MSTRESSPVSFGLAMLVPSLLLVALLLPVWLNGRAHENVTAPSDSPDPHAGSVLTQHNDNARTGANLHETILTTQNVNASQFGKLFERRVNGHIYAQPLYVAALDLPGAGRRNVVIVATMHNSVYCFDAADAAQAQPYWHVTLGHSVPARRYGEVEIKREVGITSTPVIDLASRTVYVESKAWESPADAANPATVSHCVHRLHALDLTTGRPRRGSGVRIAAQVPGTGPDTRGGIRAFAGDLQLQRAGLLLDHGVIYLGFGAQYGDYGDYHGWVLAYDAATLRQVGVFCDTPDGNQGGIWQSANGLSSDADGNVYAVCSNGTTTLPRGGRDIGCGVVRLRLDRRATTPSLHLVDWFAPSDYARLSRDDIDLCSAPLLVPGSDRLLVGGKDQKLYVLNRDHLGHWQAGDNPHTVQTFIAAEGAPRSTVLWRDPAASDTLLTWTGWDYLKAFHLVQGRLQPTIIHGLVRAPEAMPGAILSVSANGRVPGTAIVWASIPIAGNPNQEIVPGVLRAFDAAHIDRELWHSEQNAARDRVGSFAKFCAPTIAGGKVYLASFSDKLVVYGQLR